MRSVEKSLDTARTSACATTNCIDLTFIPEPGSAILDGDGSDKGKKPAELLLFAEDAL